MLSLSPPSLSLPHNISLDISFCDLSEVCVLWLVLCVTDWCEQYILVIERSINILSYKLTSVSNNFLQLSPTPHVPPGGVTEGSASFGGWNLLSHIVASCDYIYYEGNQSPVPSQGNTTNISSIWPQRLVWLLISFIILPGKQPAYSYLWEFCCPILMRDKRVDTDTHQTRQIISRFLEVNISHVIHIVNYRGKNRDSISYQNTH